MTPQHAHSCQSDAVPALVPALAACFVVGFQFTTLTGLSSFGPFLFSVIVLWLSPSRAYVAALACTALTTAVYIAQIAVLPVKFHNSFVAATIAYVCFLCMVRGPP